jgi:hypothetical protein
MLILLVLFSRKDRKWKISDFGFTSEYSSNSCRISDAARGTPGYKAPEFIRDGEINKAVDIWSLGCILYELATGKKLFVTDGECYYYAGGPVELSDDDTLSNASRTAITECLRDMIRLDHLSRPQASELLDRFHKYKDELARITTSPIAALQHSTNAPCDETVTIEPPTEQPETEPVETFKWTVINAIVNNPNTYIVVHSSCEESHSHSRVMLWKTYPLKLLENELPTELPPNVYLAFTEGGNYLAVCFGQRVEILNMQTAKVSKSWTIPLGTVPTCVAVTPELERIPVSGCENSFLGLNSRSESKLKSLLPDEIRGTNNNPGRVDVVVTPLRTEEVDMIYGGDGRRLFVIYKPYVSRYDEQTIIGYWFDLRSGNRVGRILFPEGVYRQSPLYSIQNDVVITSSNPSTSPRTTLSICETNVQRIVLKFGADEMVCGAGPGGYLLLTRGHHISYYDPAYWEADWDPEFNSRGAWQGVDGGYPQAQGGNVESLFLWGWDGEQKKPKLKGLLKAECPFHFDEVRSLVLTPNGVVLITERDPIVIPARIEPTLPGVRLKSKPKRIQER